MPGFDVNQLVTVARSLPQATPDGKAPVANSRGGKYGEGYSLSLVPTKHLLADEGSYFVATNPTIGTGVAYALQTAFSDTAALFAIQNTNAPGGKRIYLDYLRLLLTVAPTATVSMELAVKLDTKDRTPTAGNAAIVPVNVNGDEVLTPGASIQAFSAAALTVPASGASARTVARAHFSTGLGIVGDEYVLPFGAADIGNAIPGLTATRATAPARFVGNAPPVVIGPQQWAVIYLWWLTAATTAPSFEYELAGWAR